MQVTCWCCKGTGTMDVRPPDYEQALDAVAKAEGRVKDLAEQFARDQATAEDLKSAIVERDRLFAVFFEIAQHYRRLEEGAPYPQPAYAYEGNYHPWAKRANSSQQSPAVVS